MPDFCGDPICELRIQVWLMVPNDPPTDPCRQCRGALEALLGVDGGAKLPTLPDLYEAVMAR